MDNLISVIVPIYNVEKYLDRCIKSIVNQSYTNLEIILVDDGSPDRCGEICDEWVKKDNRIKVIHKENGGLSDARNAGIEIAKGEYLSFIDSDDYVNKDFIKILYNLLIENNSDISMCGVCETKKDEDINKEIGKGNIRNILSKNALEGKEHVYCVAWNKLYKKSIFKNIRYPKGKIHEDVAVIYKIMYYSEKISITDSKLYFYFSAPESIMRSKFSEKRLEILDALKDSYEFFIKRNEENYAYFVLMDFLNTILALYKECYLLEEDKKKVKRDLRKKYKKTYKKVISNSNTSLKMKLKYTIYDFLPSMYIVISKIKSVNV